MTKILKDLLQLRVELDDNKSNFITKGDLELAFKENNRLSSDHLLNSNFDKVRLGRYNNLDSGPFGLSPVPIAPRYSI